MLEIAAQEAIIQMQRFEESIRALASPLDMDVSRFLTRYVIPPQRPDTWAAAFTAAWNLLNEEYRDQILHDLARDAKYLRTLLPPGDAPPNPFKELLLHISATGQGIKAARELYDDLGRVYGRGSTDGALRGFARAAVVRLLDDLRGTIVGLEDAQRSMQEKVNSWKEYFMILSQKDHLRDVALSLQADVPSNVLLESIPTLFEKLISVVNERRRILDELQQLRMAKTLAWMAPQTGVIQTTELASALAVLAVQKEFLENNKVSQEAVLRTLQTVAGDALVAPQTLCGPHGCEVSVGRLREARNEFEALRMLSAHTAQLLYGAYDELKDAKAASDAEAPYTVAFART